MRAILTWAAAPAALLLAAIPAYAHDDAKPEKVEKAERVVIITRDGRTGEHRNDVRRFHVMSLDRAAECSGDKTEVNESSTDGKQKTRILVCGEGKLSAADRAERLQRVIGRIQSNDELSAEHKAKVVAALHEAIDRLRAGR